MRAIVGQASGLSNDQARQTKNPGNGRRNHEILETHEKRLVFDVQVVSPIRCAKDGQTVPSIVLLFVIFVCFVVPTDLSGMTIQLAKRNFGGGIGIDLRKRFQNPAPFTPRVFIPSNEFG